VLNETGSARDFSKENFFHPAGNGYSFLIRNEEGECSEEEPWRPPRLPVPGTDLPLANEQPLPFHTAIQANTDLDGRKN